MRPVPRIPRAERFLPRGFPLKATVTVELKNGVLDPQGKAIRHSLDALSFEEVEDVRVGRLFRITLDDSAASLSDGEIEQRIRQMCEKLLANTVVENYQITIER